MLGFIIFSFKIIVSAILGALISYNPKDDYKKSKIIETSLISIFSTSVIALTKQLSVNGDNLSMGFGLLTVFISIIFLSKSLAFEKRIIWYFAAIAGSIIGSGYIFQASILILLIYIILHNSETLLNYFNSEYENNEDNSIENI